MPPYPRQQSGCAVSGAATSEGWFENATTPGWLHCAALVITAIQIVDEDPGPPFRATNTG
jgi:hypothetical protein